MKSPNRKSLPRRLGALLLTLLVLLSGGTTAVPAQAETNPNYWLTPAYAGSEMHVPVLLYRHRHTTLQARQNLKPDVTWARNVAAFEYYTSGNIRLVIVGPSLPQNFATHPDTVPFDIYREVNGAWTLVDSNGDPLEADGKPVDWRNSSQASVVWNPRADADPAIQDVARAGRHSEWTTSLYLMHKVMGANATSRRGLSERIPCESGANNCRRNLRTETGGLYPGLEIMEYITDQLGSDQAAKDLEKTQQVWENADMPTHANAEQMLGWRLLVTPGSPTPSGAASSALAPGADPGGIDFSTLELRYLKEGSGGRLEYAFNAAAADGAKHNAGTGQLAATQSSDAFFVWLSMPESTFWVNLNPNEPDRIVDAKLGTTDVGRIMLEADFRLKKVVGRLIQPDTDLGRRFWGEPSTTAARCIDMRQWIVPEPATVYEQDGGLYIVNAQLDVKMETEYLQQHGQPTGCVSPDAAMADRFRTLVLPQVVQEVNQGPDFAELRRIYLSRVAASWYRQRHSGDGALSGLIDSGNVTAWPALRTWSPRQVFDQYVDSYQKKEFDVTRRVKVGNTEYEVTYTHGGVDLTNIQLNQLPQAQFQHDHAGLPAMLQQSLDQQVTDGNHKIWLGAVSHPVPLPDLNQPDPPTSDPLFYALVTLPLAVWLVLGVWSLLRRRRKANRSVIEV